MSRGSTFLRRALRLGALAAILAVGACGETAPRQKVYSVLGSGTSLPEPAPVQVEAQEPASTAPVDRRGEADFYQPGSGRFVRSAPAPAAPGAEPGDITLNFENTPLQEVVKVVLGDLLQKNYSVDPGIQGVVTLQTSNPLRREDLLRTLEGLLAVNNAALVHDPARDLYRVTPLEGAVRASSAPEVGGGALPPGYAVRVVPLRYISALEMQKILEPFANPTNLVRVDATRNLIVLAGSSREIGDLLATIEVFDVDWLEGMSVGLFTPDFVDAKTLAADLQSIFGSEAEGPLAGLVRFVLIERLDALLVITARPELLEKASGWIDRLDHDTGTAGQRLFVYHVQNGRAVELASVLTEVFRDEGTPVAPIELAPGTRPGRIQSEPAPAAREGEPASDVVLEPPSPVVDAGGEGVALSGTESIRIIADEVNNALVILATAQQYRQVEAAIRSLDIVPLQVLIEATIAEVTLTGELSLGLEWFFKNNVGSKTGRGTLDLGATGLQALAPGFSYAIVDALDVRLVLNTLAEESKLNIISSPSLMVLNNQQATIEVGDQVPVTTAQQQSVSGQSNIVNSIEYRDTGVLLTVTPRVNAGGLVIMDIEQEVSNVDEQQAAGGGEATQNLTPTIQQRRITSTVAIQSGETVVLGGLIRESKDDDEQGIPFLHTIPVLGYLFGAKRTAANRTELVVLITPRAVQGAREARDITNEFRRKMESLKPLVATPAPRPAEPPAEPEPEPAPEPKPAAALEEPGPAPSEPSPIPEPGPGPAPSASVDPAGRRFDGQVAGWLDPAEAPAEDGTE